MERDKYMWSKTRKRLNNLLAGSLKGRLVYNHEVYTTNKYKYNSEMHVFYIYLDKQIIFATNPLGEEKYSGEISNMLKKVDKNEEFILYKALEKLHYSALSKSIYETGYISIQPLMKYLHKYIYTISIDEALTSENYIYHIFAIFDRRLGKRRLIEIVKNVDTEPEWFRKYVIIRAKAEGMI